MNPFTDLLNNLDADKWRTSNPFSDDIREFNDCLINEQASVQEQKEFLLKWIATVGSQLCQFGRSSSHNGKLYICLVNEEDLLTGPTHLKKLIKRESLQWKTLASQGRANGFLIAVISQSFVNSAPNEKALQLVEQFAEICFDQKVVDTSANDNVWMKIPTKTGLKYRRWLTKASLLSVQGDGRWWRDRRIPGGFAFSINSIGQWITSTLADVGYDSELRHELVYTALPMAMNTIKLAWLDTNGTPKINHGTELVERSEKDGDCPYDSKSNRFRSLTDYSENRYAGSYRTHIAIPSAFFDTSIEEKNIDIDDLSFSYIHSSEDERFREIGLGSLSNEIKEYIDKVNEELFDQ